MLKSKNLPQKKPLASVQKLNKISKKEVAPTVSTKSSKRSTALRSAKPASSRKTKPVVSFHSIDKSGLSLSEALNTSGKLPKMSESAPTTALSMVARSVGRLRRWWIQLLVAVLIPVKITTAAASLAL